MDAFVHASGDGFGNTAPLRSDTGAIDMDAISQVAHVTQGAGKLTRKEKKHAKREMKRRKKEAKKAEKEAKKTYSSIKSQLKDRDKELSDKMADARKKRDSAKDVVNYIGYNKMYQDGICEVEEGMFSSSIAFDDTSYHSVRDEQQKAMFSAITRLYDQFGADTLVQMSVINTPLLKEEVGHRKFFDPERQANDAARNDAQVFNNILNDKVKEGVSNIRRNRYLTYSVTADTAEDAARQLSRIEVESSRILNSIGSKAHLMNGTQRLSVIHSLLNPYKPFLFDYQRDISAKRLQTTKDCIAPTQIDFRPDGHYNDCVKLDNGVYAQVLVMKKFGSELSDRALADMADLPIPMAITWYVQPIRPRSGNPDNQPIASVPSVKGLTEHDRLAVCAKHLPLRHSLLSPAFALVGSIKAFECPSLRVLHAPLVLTLEVQKLFLKICRFRSRIDQTVQQCQCPVPHRPVKRLLDGIPQKPHVLLLDFLLAHIHPFSSAVRTASPCHTSFVPRSRVRTRNGR